MFRDTVMKSVTPFRTVQSATAMPDGIMPVYVGSGSLVLGLDATGMQGLGNRVQAAFRSSPEAADLYAVGHGMVGDTLNPNITIPYGWFDYCLEADGERYDAERILREGSLFRRDNDIYRGTVTTSFVLGGKLRVEWTVYAPSGGKSVVFELRTEDYDPNVGRTGKRREAAVEATLHLTTRKGAPIYDRAECSERAGGARVLAEVRGHEDYRVEIFCRAERGEVSFAKHCLTRRVKIGGGSLISA